MTALASAAAFDVQNSAFSAEMSSKLFTIKHAARLADDPVNLAVVMANIADQTRGSLHFVSGSINGSVKEGMYDVMRGGFETNTDIVTVLQSQPESEIMGKVSASSENRCREVVLGLEAAFQGRIEYVFQWPVRDPQVSVTEHRKVLHDVVTGTTEPMVNQQKPDQPLGKVGNFVSVDMHGLQRVPQDVRELLLLQRRALRKIGVTALSATARHELVSGEGQPIDTLSAMAIVMESHLETRVRRHLDAAFLSYFTCGDAKHPRGAADFFYNALQPEYAMLHTIDRGGNNGRPSIQSSVMGESESDAA